MSNKYDVIDLMLDEVSLVDVPANPLALAALAKRDASHDLITKGLNKAQKTAFFALVREKGMNPMAALTEVNKMSDDSKKIEELTALNVDMTKKLDEAQKALEAMTAAVVKAGGKIEDKGGEPVVVIEKSDPEEYVEVEGVKIAKSKIDPAVLTVIEKQNKVLAKMKEDADFAVLVKRASNEFGNLSGTDVAKARLLKAVDSLPEDDRSAVMSTLKAADAALGDLFKERGHSKVDDETSPESKLEKMVAEYAEKNSVHPDLAYAEVTKGGVGRSLLLDIMKKA